MYLYLTLKNFFIAITYTEEKQFIPQQVYAHAYSEGQDYVNTKSDNGRSGFSNIH